MRLSRTPPPPLAMAPLFASPTATRFAAHWIADALAADEAIDFSVVKALVGASPESLAGAPEATRERVALRCLQEVAAIASGGDAAAMAGVLRVDGARSCEGVLLQLIGEVGCSGNLEKGMLPPFSQDIQNIICIKKPTLPETSFELLKEVDPGIACTAPPSHMEQNGTNQCDNDQSLYNSHSHANIEDPKFPTVNAEPQQEILANIIDETDMRNLQKDPIVPTSVRQDQPCTSDSRCYDHLQEDAVGARSPEMRSIVEKGNISVGAVPTSASGDETLQGSISEPLSKQDKEDNTTIVQKSSNPPQYTNGERPQDDHAKDQSSKNPVLNTDATVAPASERSSNAIPENALKGSISEPLSKQDKEDNTTIVQKSSNPPHYTNGERPQDDHAKDQSSKNLVLNTDATVAPASDRSSSAIPENASELVQLPEHITAQDTSMISQPHSSKTHSSAPQHENGVEVNQDLDVSSSIQPVKKDHVPEELIVQAASVPPSVRCIAGIQGGNYGTNHPPGGAAEHTTRFQEQNGDKSHIEVSATDKVNESLHNDGSILEKNVVRGELNVLTSPHQKVSEASNLSEQSTVKNRTDVHKGSCSTSVLNSAQYGDTKSATKTSKNKNLGDAFVEISEVPSLDDSLGGTAAAGLLKRTDKMLFWPKDQDFNDPLGGMSQQDLCIKCGKDGQLLKCSGCLLAAHDSCFGSSVTFEANLFYCPVCFYTKATEAYQKAEKTYCEARKNLAAFLGTTRLAGQHDEQLTGVLPGVADRESPSNGCDSSKRKHIHQNEAYNLASRDKESCQQRKKLKTNATGNGYPEEVVSEKASRFQNSDAAPMDKHSVHHSNSSKRVQGVEKHQKMGTKEACREAGNVSSSHVTRSSSENRCDPLHSNQEVEAGKEGSLTNSHHSVDSDEIEATSSNDSGKRSSPPWRNTRQRKENETVISSNSRKTIAQQDQHMPSSSRKRNYAYPQKRYSNPVAPSGRRSKLCWTEEEETALKEAMEKFNPQDDAPISWVQILEYGRDVFHKTRLPADLRVKWRNMKRKAD